MTNTNTQTEVRAQLARTARESLAHTLQVRVTRMQDCAAKVAELAAQIEAADENGAAVEAACEAMERMEKLLRNLDLASLTRGVAEVLR
jgi:hypothetical protein